MDLKKIYVSVREIGLVRLRIGIVGIKPLGYIRYGVI